MILLNPVQITLGPEDPSADQSTLSIRQFARADEGSFELPSEEGHVLKTFSE